MDIPEELKNLQTPVIKIAGNKITINNKPLPSDYYMLVGLSVLLCLVFPQNFQYKNEYIALGLGILILLAFTSFSLEKVTVDMAEKKIYRRNKNPVVNSYRRLFKIPQEIAFKDVEAFETVVNTGARSPSAYKTVVCTDVVFKLGVALFKKKAEADMFDVLLKSICHTPPNKNYLHSFFV